MSRCKREESEPRTLKQCGPERMTAKNFSVSNGSFRLTSLLYNLVVSLTVYSISNTVSLSYGPSLKQCDTSTSHRRTNQHCPRARVIPWSISSRTLFEVVLNLNYNYCKSRVRSADLVSICEKSFDRLDTTAS